MTKRIQPLEALILASPEDVKILRAAPRMMKATAQGVRLAVTSMSEAERNAWERRLKELGEVCGCLEGSIAGGIAAIAAILFWATTAIVVSVSALAATLAGILAISIAAKFLRVLLARIQTVRLLSSLLNEIDSSTYSGRGGIEHEPNMRRVS